MSTITVRAPDSVTALELVQRRLGDDALILSNLWIDGQVEITASDEMPDPVTRPRKSASVDVLIGDPVPSPARTAEPARLPGFLDPHAPKPFARMLEAEKSAPRRLTGQANRDSAPARPDPLILRDRLLCTPRIVLCGPVGAGKSQVALQLALMRLARRPQTQVDFFFCGTGSHGDGAFLAQKSHLLGMDTHFIPPADLPASTTGQVQIVVISGRAGDGPAAAETALSLPEARAALVLPAGLRRGRLHALRKFWGDQGAAAILTDPDADLPGPEEQDDLAATRILPLWVSAPERLIGGLRVVEDPKKAAPTPQPSAETAAQPITFRRHTAAETRP
jgi:hypothetical protein